MYFCGRQHSQSLSTLNENNLLLWETSVDPDKEIIAHDNLSTLSEDTMAWCHSTRKVKMNTGDSDHIPKVRSQSSLFAMYTVYTVLKREANKTVLKREAKKTVLKREANKTRGPNGTLHVEFENNDAVVSEKLFEYW